MKGAVVFTQRVVGQGGLVIQTSSQQLWVQTIYLPIKKH